MDAALGGARQCAAAGIGAEEPEVQEQYGWAPVLAEAMQTATLEPREPIWPTMELALRSGISSVLTGQKNAKDALDAVATDWQRALRRAGLKG